MMASLGGVATCAWKRAVLAQDETQVGAIERGMLRFELEHPTLRLAWIRAEGTQAAPSSEALLHELARAEAHVRSDPTLFPEPVRSALRDVLRLGGYKPTGRGKPASELLLAMALREGLPRINNLVDSNNLASLESAHPISIFDADLLGDQPRVRFGRSGEHYVFNASGHAMELAGLPVVCRRDAEPVGNAVRDSMSCKVHAGTTRALAIVYGSSRLPAALLRAAAERLAALLRAHAGAGHVEMGFVPALGAD